MSNLNAKVSEMDSKKNKTKKPAFSVEKPQSAGKRPEGLDTIACSQAHTSSSLLALDTKVVHLTILRVYYPQ